MNDSLAIVAAWLVAGVFPAFFVVAFAFPLARWARIPLDEASIGSGPKLFTVRIGKTPLTVHLWWSKSTVAFRGMDAKKPFTQPEPPLRAWADVPAWQRAVLVLAHQPMPVLLASFVLGGSATVHAIGRGIVDYPAAFHGSFPLLDLAAKRYHDQGFAALVAIILTKIFATFLYMLPSVLIFRLRRPGMALDGPTKLNMVMAVVMIVVNVAWTIDFVRWTIARW